jgi:hypothetical protein
MSKRSSFLAVVAFVLLVLATILPGSNAEASAARARIQQLNSQLTSLLNVDTRGNRTTTQRRLAALATERIDLLAKLAQNDAAATKQAQLPKHILESVPANLSSLFEQEVSIEGELQVVGECEETNGRTLYFVETGKERLQVSFVGSMAEELKTGSRISVRGTRVRDQLIAERDSLTITRDIAELTSSAVVGEKKVLVLLVNFQDNAQSQPYTIDQVNNLLFNRSNPSSVANYYLEASYGQTSITGDTVGWFTLPMTSGQCDATTTIANNAKQAAANAGINLAAYSNYMYVFPNMGCSWAGWGEIGGRNTWIDGSLYLRTTAHELGHNFGLYHSRGMNCGTSVIGSNCTTTEYGHIADMIGSPGVTGNFNPFQKERLGWLNNGSSPIVTTVSGSGTYTIGGLSLQDGAPKGLKILKSTDSGGRRTWYYVEFRRPVGFDSFVLNDSNTMNGVLVTLDQESNGAENYLLDMVPATADWSDSALRVGTSFVDSGIGLTITPLSVSDSGAVVSVSFGSTPCALSMPTITADPSSTQWVNPGSSATYNVQIGNNNSGSCQPTAFSLGAAIPAGWSWTAESTSIVLPPGASANLMVNVTPAAGSTGSSNLTFSAANSENSRYASSVVRSVGIAQPLAISVSTNRSTYMANQTVVAYAHVSSNGAPMTGLPVTFTVTKPNGRVATYSAVTTSTGTATISYRVNKKQDPPGGYTVRAVVESGGFSSSASTGYFIR